MLSPGVKHIGDEGARKFEEKPGNCGFDICPSQHWCIYARDCMWASCQRSRRADHKLSESLFLKHAGHTEFSDGRLLENEEALKDDAWKHHAKSHSQQQDRCLVSRLTVNGARVPVTCQCKKNTPPVQDFLRNKWLLMQQDSDQVIGVLWSRIGTDLKVFMTQGQRVILQTMNGTDSLSG